MPHLRAAVVGAGPAGLYAARALASRYPTCVVDVLERLPVPFGLVRYGVSPDHPSTKNAITQLSTTFSNARIRFLGNVATGPATRLPPAELSRRYHVVVHATGASAPRLHPSLAEAAAAPSGVLPAHAFAHWANGHPELPASARREIEQRLLRPDPRVAVVGVGNVAIDVARVLLRPADSLEDTDVSPRALAVLRDARVRGVDLVGRRSPVDAKWTAAALRELLTKVPAVVAVAPRALVQRDLRRDDLLRPQKRCLKLLAERTVDESSPVDPDARLLRLRFLQEPTAFADRPDGRVTLNLRATADDAVDEELVRDAVFLSLGYQGGSGPGYRVGWANGKGRGIIGDNKVDAETVVAAMPPVDTDAISCRPGLDDWQRATGVEVVDWHGWLRIDEEERRRGREHGRRNGRVKLESISEMLQVARGQSPPR